MKKIMDTLATPLILAASIAFNAQGALITTWEFTELMYQSEIQLSQLDHYDVESITIYLFPMNDYWSLHAEFGNGFFPTPQNYYDKVEFNATDGFPQDGSDYNGSFDGEDFGFMEQTHNVEIALLMIFRYNHEVDSVGYDLWRLYPGDADFNPNLQHLVQNKLLIGNASGTGTGEGDIPTYPPSQIFFVDRWDYYQDIPEPATGLLVLGGMAMLLLRRRRRG